MDVSKIMEAEVLKIGKELKLASIYRSNDKYVGVIGYKDENRKNEAYENVLVYDTNNGSVSQIHITTAIIELPETKELNEKIG